MTTRGRAHGQRRRLLPSLVGVALVAFLVATFGRASAQTVGGGTATADSDGWWSFANGGAQTAVGLPNTPLPVPVPDYPPKTVPDDAIGVGANLGDASAVAAVGIVLDAGTGATVDRLVVTLRQAEGPGANVNAETATIVACPITSFWVAGDNGDWASRPEADCDLAKAPGTRQDDGTWTFDLSAIATAWLDPFGTLGQNGVLLVEDADAPASFQVSFVDVEHDGVQVDFAATGGAGASDDAFALGAGGTSGAEVVAPAPSFGGTVSLPPVAAPATTAAPVRTAAPRAAGTTAAKGSPIVGNLPIGYLLLVPLALGLALLTTLALGPAGEPGRRQRTGGVRRVLSARERARPPVPPRPSLEAS